MNLRSLAATIKQNPCWFGFLRFALWTGFAALVWSRLTKGWPRAILMGALVIALPRLRPSWPAWSNSAGIAFLALIAFSAIGLIFSTRPALSAYDAAMALGVYAFAFAIPVLLNSPDRIGSAILHSATALTVILGSHLVHVAMVLKNDIWNGARGYEPFMIANVNIESMLACAAFIAFCAFAWMWRHRPWRVVASLAGALVDLAYLLIMASRGAQFATAVTAVISGFLFLRTWKGRLVWFLLIAVAGGIVLNKMEWINPRFRTAGWADGFTGRDKVWSHTWELAKERPVLGHGIGGQVFMDTYHNSNPPPSPHYYWHPHSYWLFVLFAQGWVGVALHATAWALLCWRLLRRGLLPLDPLPQVRLLSGLVLLLILFFMVAGLADWPSGQAHIMLFWLVPAALVLTRSGGASQGRENLPVGFFSRS